MKFVVIPLNKSKKSYSLVPNKQVHPFIRYLRVRAQQHRLLAPKREKFTHDKKNACLEINRIGDLGRSIFCSARVTEP